MYYIIRWSQDFSRIIDFIQDENECAIQYDTVREAEEAINGSVIEPLLEIIEL